MSTTDDILRALAREEVKESFKNMHLEYHEEGEENMNEENYVTEEVEEIEIPTRPLMTKLPPQRLKVRPQPLKAHPHPIECVPEQNVTQVWKQSSTEESPSVNKSIKLTLDLITGNDNGVKDVSILERIIGQKEAINKISFFVKSHSETTPFPTMLFSGSQGLGKTFCSSKVAESLGRELIEVNCGNYSSGYDTVSKFITEVLVKRVIGDKPKTLLLDEAHELSSDIMTLLLTLLNPPIKGTINYYAYGDFILGFDLSKINVIFATTDAYKILKPLVNRCVEIYFHPYSLDELHEMLGSYLHGISIECNKEDISYACRGRGRDTYILSQNIKRYASMRNIDVIDDKAWKEFKGIFGVHLNGLNSQEVGLLKILKDHSPISSHNIALMLGVNERNVDSELEVRPRELGYIESGSRGRTISSKGIEYLDKLNEMVEI